MGRKNTYIKTAAKGLVTRFLLKVSKQTVLNGREKITKNSYHCFYCAILI